MGLTTIRAQKGNKLYQVWHSEVFGFLCSAITPKSESEDVGPNGSYCNNKKNNCSDGSLASTQENGSTLASAASSTGIVGYTLFAYDEAGHLIGEYDEAGNVIRQYIWLNDRPIAMLANGQVYYIHTDHLNTPQVVTDAAQQVVWQGRYTPFGEVETTVSSVDMPLRFPGQYYDAETGLNYNYFRSYNPATGRYTQSDPIGLEAGPNLFTYVEGNPVNYIDPKGLARERTRIVDCNLDELESCYQYCQSKGETVESCKRVEKFRLTRSTKGMEVWRWVKIGSTSCSCTESFCGKNPGTCSIAVGIGTGLLVTGICLTPWPDDLLLPWILGGAALGTAQGATQ